VHRDILGGIDAKAKKYLPVKNHHDGGICFPVARFGSSRMIAVVHHPINQSVAMPFRLHIAIGALTRMDH
jgi:hypothetical protein